mmetsp:Transcript_73795/g.196398  ORF Transcript_73795/g.196398 Transcript_73795/m.196398 type:complete len:83 (-) Transcript_73795:20-268(-)
MPIPMLVKLLNAAVADLTEHQVQVGPARSVVLKDLEVQLVAFSGCGAFPCGDGAQGAREPRRQPRASRRRMASGVKSSPEPR